jgi:hypothetical protein
MSILRHFNKHQGWHDGKRTPFADLDPFGSGISDLMQKTNDFLVKKYNEGAFGDLHIGGGGNWINQAFSPLGGVGNDIAKGLGSVDKAVNQLPGGWALPAVVAATVAAPYLAPELAAALGGAEAGAAGAISTEAGQAAFFEALSAGATSSEAVSAGLAAQTAAAGAGALTTGEILSSSGFTPTAGGSFAIEPGATYGAASGLGANAITATPGADAILNAPQTTLSNLTPPGTGTFGSISPPLTGSGAIPGAGALTNSAGLTGALPAGVMVGDGTLGTTIGQTYMAAAPGQFAVDAFGSAIPAGTAGIAGTVPSGLSLADIATNAKRLQSIAKLLGGSGAKITGKSAPTAAQWATQAGQNFAQATPQQFGGLYEMNKNPFTFSNPLAAALRSNTSGLDVSGTGGTTLQSANLAKLLA